jgi:hypothetical protein
MKKVLSLWLILLLVLAAGCAPKPAQSEFVQPTDSPATAAPTEAPVDESLILLTEAPGQETPAPTDAPQPTDTPAPTDTPVPTDAPTPSPAPKGTESPVQYGEDYDDKDRGAR